MYSASCLYNRRLAIGYSITKTEDVADADTGEQVGCVYLGWGDVQLHNIAAVRITRCCRDWPQSSIYIYSVVSDAVRIETVNQSLSSNRASRSPEARPGAMANLVWRHT